VCSSDLQSGAQRLAMARTKKGARKEDPGAAAAAAAAAADDGPSTSYDATLPASLEEQRTRIVCKPDRNLHVRSTCQYCGSHATVAGVAAWLCWPSMLRLQAVEVRRPDTCLAPIFLMCRRPAPLHSPPLQTTSTIAATQWASLGVDAAFDLARFKRGFDINITRYEGDDMEFEMKGVSCAVRRMPCKR